MSEVAWSQSNIISEWANKQDPVSLLNFLDRKLEAGRPPDQFYVSQDTDSSCGMTHNVRAPSILFSPV